MAYIKDSKKQVRIIYDWEEKYDKDELTKQDVIKLSVIELNKIYREGKDSPASDKEYDFIFEMIEDEEFKKSVGTSLGEDFKPKCIDKEK